MLPALHCAITSSSSDFLITGGTVQGNAVKPALLIAYNLDTASCGTLSSCCWTLMLKPPVAHRPCAIERCCTDVCRPVPEGMTLIWMRHLHCWQRISIATLIGHLWYSICIFLLPHWFLYATHTNYPQNNDYNSTNERPCSKIASSILRLIFHTPVKVVLIFLQHKYPPESQWCHRLEYS